MGGDTSFVLLSVFEMNCWLFGWLMLLVAI
jgi:hypothetical protein